MTEPRGAKKRQLLASDLMYQVMTPPRVTGERRLAMRQMAYGPSPIAIGRYAYGRQAEPAISPPRNGKFVQLVGIES
jgi:hypothetical protein